MTETEGNKPPLIYAAMAAILGEIDAIPKNRRNQEQNFQFRGIDDVLNELHGAFKKHKVFVTSELLGRECDPYTTSKGTFMRHWVGTYQFTFHAEDGSSISSVMAGEASDAGDKGLLKTASAAFKMTLLQAFLIATEEEKDPDGQTPDPPSTKGQGKNSPGSGTQKPPAKGGKPPAQSKPPTEEEKAHAELVEKSNSLLELALQKGVAKAHLRDFCKAVFATHKLDQVDGDPAQFTAEHWKIAFEVLGAMDDKATGSKPPVNPADVP